MAFAEQLQAKAMSKTEEGNGKNNQEDRPMMMPVEGKIQLSFTPLGNLIPCWFTLMRMWTIWTAVYTAMK